MDLLALTNGNHRPHHMIFRQVDKFRNFFNIKINVVLEFILADLKTGHTYTVSMGL
jgi:hypothetical protein